MRRLSLPLLLLVPGAALAQPVLLEDIILSANRTESLPALTGPSVDVLPGAQFELEEQNFLLDYLSRLPGVTINQSGPPGAVSGFSIRGVPQRYTKVLFDGIDISDPSAPTEDASLSGLLVGTLGRVEVLKGSQSALYGGQAVGGVVAIDTRRPTRDGIAQYADIEAGSYRTLTGDYSILGRNPRGEFSLNVVGYRTDGFSAADENAGNTEEDGYRTGRASLTGRLYVSDTADAFGTLFLQDEDGEYDSGFPITDADNSFDNRSWGARVGGIATTGTVDHLLAFSWFDVRRENTEPAGFNNDAFSGDRARVEYLGESPLGARLALLFGADAERERATVNGAGAGETENVGVFAQVNYAASEALSVSAALRQDAYSDFGGFTTGRLTGAFIPRPGTTLRATAATGFRAPALFELFDERFGLGNPELEPEESVSYEVGLEQRVGGGAVSATFFQIDIENLIEVPLATFVNVPGTSRSRGVSLAAAYPITPRIDLGAAYTYTDATDGAGARRVRVPRHDASLTLAGAVTERTTFAVSGRYVADVIDLDTFPLPPSPLDDFLVVNATVSYAVADGASLYLRVENAFDTEYQLVRGYGTSDRAVYAGLRAQF